jgi:DNA ligase D-like protein (predicted ligase)
MLCETATFRGSSGPDLSLLKREGWSYELKLDGVRILAHKNGRDVRLVYRSGRDATRTYPEITAAVAGLGVGSAVLDGEIVAFDDAGRPSFGRLQQRIGLAPATTHGPVPVAYVVFDVLRLDGRDTTGLPLSERRALLSEIVPDEGLVRMLDVLEGDGRPLFELCRREGLEGVVAKRDASTYKPGQRSADWVKVKAERSEEFVVVAWTRGRGGGIGALDVATYEGDRLVARGKVGSGIGDVESRDLQRRFAAIVVDECAAEGPLEPAPLGRTFVKPEIVISVRFHSWTEDGRVRQPVYRGIREDVLPRECTARPGDVVAKRDASCVAYYDAVADAMAPHVRDAVPSARALRDRVAAGETTFALACGPVLVLEAKDAKVARALRALLDRIGLAGFPKASPGKLEVLVPLGRAAKPETLAALGPLVASLVAGVEPRASTLAPYSLVDASARHVSTPLSWDELDSDPRAFTPRTVPARLAERGDLAAALPKAKVALARAVEHLEQILQSR